MEIYNTQSKSKKNVIQKSYFKYSLDGKIFIHDMQKKKKKKLLNIHEFATTTITLL